jgi:hypothetical protein
MIGTIRKHSSWLWWVVAGLTIVSFVIFMGNGGTRGGGTRNGDRGNIYGKPVTEDAYVAAQQEFRIYYWLHYGEFPERSANFSSTELDRETYVRLLLTAKARSLGIHVTDEATVAAANDMLRSMGRNGQAVPMSEFLERILAPNGLTAADYQRFVADDLMIEQLVQALGLPGGLIPPQQAGQLYDREHQEVSAQAVFFSASNYLGQVTVTPAAVSQFYTNYMAHYRLPDRVQINYLAYDLTNFMAAAELKAGKTNLDNEVETYFNQHGLDSVPDAKTPEEARAKIRQSYLRQGAAQLAAEEARTFVDVLFRMEPVSLDNFVTLARKNGLTVHTTAPFSETDGPLEFSAPPDLISTAFKLNADSPFSKPIAGTDAIYVIGLAAQLPSEVPPFDQIHNRVTEDLQYSEAAFKARTDGTNFYYSASVQIAAGSTFAKAALNSGQAPVALEPFSLGSKEVPEAEGHAEVGQVKQAAFTTAPGHLSPFMATADGGFILFVQSMLPVDEAAKTAEMPQFLSQLRRSRETEAFNVWLQTEVNHELRDTPLFKELAEGKGAPGSPAP